MSRSKSVGTVERFLGLRRGWRIVIAGVFALAFTMVIFPVVDRIYLSYFFDLETRLLPSYISALFGVIVYVVGWRVSVSNDIDAVVSENSIKAYLAFGVGVLFFLGVLVVLGLATGMQPTF